MDKTPEQQAEAAIKNAYSTLKALNRHEVAFEIDRAGTAVINELTSLREQLQEREKAIDLLREALTKLSKLKSAGYELMVWCNDVHDIANAALTKTEPKP